MKKIKGLKRYYRVVAYPWGWRVEDKNCLGFWEHADNTIYTPLTGWTREKVWASFKKEVRILRKYG